MSVLLVCLKPTFKDSYHTLKPKLVDVTAAEHLPGGPGAEVHDVGQDQPPLQGEAAAVRNANTPMAALGPAAKPFHFSGPLADRMRARACLAAAMLFEAGDDGVGQYAVGQVVLNRVRHPAFPNTVCGVILQGSERATGCQFTFTCDGALARRTNADSRARALGRADMMLSGLVFAHVGLATHYHTVDVHPWWSSRLEKIARQGAHLFFRWSGYWGSSGALVDRHDTPEPSAALFLTLYPLPDQNGALNTQADLPQLSQESSATVMPPLNETKAAQHIDAMRDAGGTMVPASRRLFRRPEDERQSTSVVIGAAALEGSRLLRMFSEEGVFFLHLSAGTSEHARRRVAAMLCGGRTKCSVYGWLDAAFVPATVQLGPASEAKLDFRYVRMPMAGTRAVPASANAF